MSRCRKDNALNTTRVVSLQSRHRAEQAIREGMEGIEGGGSKRDDRFENLENLLIVIYINVCTSVSS